MDRTAAALEAKSDEKRVRGKKPVVGNTGKKVVGIKEMKTEDNPAMDLAKHVDSSIASSKTICLTVPPCSLTDLLSSSACVFSASTPQIKRPVDILFAYYRHFFKKEKANQRQSRDGIVDSMTLHRECPF
ncbi:hypothetical protein MG293_005958 [Ovis ammon polii]|uniref:Uncharacterized protein n=1 Tax=Ovis ammon polii TaxID=230172 RepID=A0AAD4UJ99_OVIAM|nr:hypothetical protein MG293_005958 [Ovis ammon polii]